MKYIQTEHGTNSQPGAIIRSSDGGYFSYDSNRRGLVADVSTKLGLLGVVKAVDATFDAAQPLLHDDASMISVPRTQKIDDEVDPLEGLTSWEGNWHETRIYPKTDTIVEMPTPEVLSLINRQEISISAARIAFRDFFVTWQAPYARFSNDDHESAEAGIYIRSPKQLPGLGRFLRAVARPGFIDAVQPRVIMRKYGNAKYYSI